MVSGRRLAADLSLPNLRGAWASAEPVVSVESAGVRRYRSRASRVERAAAVAGAVSAMGQASAALREAVSGDGGFASSLLLRVLVVVGDGVVHAVGDMLAAVETVTAGQVVLGRSVVGRGPIWIGRCGCRIGCCRCGGRRRRRRCGRRRGGGPLRVRWGVMGGRTRPG